MRHSIRANKYATMTVEEAEKATPLPISGDPPPRYVVSRIRIMDIPALESVGETPEGEPIFVPLVDCTIHGCVLQCECRMSRN